MKCPYCNEEMEKGFVDQTKAFFPLEWYPAKQERGILINTKRNIKLTSLRKTGRVIVHYCAACRKFIIDQNELAV